MHYVIVKFLSGEEKSGEVFSFNMNFPVFYLQSKNDKGKIDNIPIKTALIKQIIFLKKKDSNGNILHKETIDQSTYAGVLPYRLRVTFKDGQIIDGSTNKYNSKEKGFFLVPINPADKSERIYINAAAVKDVNCKRLLGKKLIDQQNITLEEVDESFKQQRMEREKKDGGQKETIAQQSEGFYIIEDEIRRTEQKLIEKTKIKPLGEIILGAGYITSHQLEDALNKQKEQKDKKLGQILVDLKHITPTDICVALASQFHLSWVDLSSLNIPQEIATILPEKTVRELGVIPVEKKDDILVVAISQPQVSLIGMHVSKFTPFVVELVIAYDGYIQSAIEKYFPRS
ncbi:MAG: hypothetical protein KJ887_03630 [Candidatus Omnitrophica bacterium]|nr:hypothetical protein [Candidatus Omnitrophota bacterium]MBU1047412.1 hypothetical protein [Candidatus Omnitrophota bacterium]MBU1630817.1 hypothetical protein [Candidatus Omnitrophota bacterium]MBU1767060.1 hypothetical protein [Candidatus Omnitrophota bacterium]MBU1888776.1 hypothetical protein [Candidatus Omnitrophota bacterium]